MEQITLTGDLCSGKSTTCKILVDALGMEYISVGNIFRKEAEEKGLTVLELNKRYEGTVNDLHLDKRIVEMRNKRDIVVDARMGWFFLPESFKVYLMTEDNEIIRRALKADRGDVETYTEELNAFKELQERKKSEISRYNKLYFVDFNNMLNFDLVVDTTLLKPDEVANIVLKAYGEFINNKYIDIDFHNLIPTQSIREINTEYIKSLDMSKCEPVKVVKKDNFFWIKDGHHRAIKAKEEGQRVKCQIVDTNILDVDISYMYDWEEAFKFRYMFNPF